MGRFISDLYIYIYKEETSAKAAFLLSESRVQSQEPYVSNIRAECFKHSPSMFQTFPKGSLRGLKTGTGRMGRNRMILFYIYEVF
jgi:hypothetical protein